MIKVAKNQAPSAYAPAYLRRLAKALASKAARREALRARAFELVASDRLGDAR